MADQPYRNQNFVFQSHGISARNVDDTLPPGFFLDEGNCEETAENSVGNRLGTAIVNRTNAIIDALPASVHSIQRLTSLNGNAYRYAGSGTSLYRRASLTQGAYSEISSTLSGQPWSSAIYRPDFSSVPYLFIADANGMLKDNGTFATPQKLGIFQPEYPVAAESQSPATEVNLDDYSSLASSYTYTGISGGANENYINTILGVAVTQTGLQEVAYTGQGPIELFQLLVIGSGASQETVLVLLVTPTGFWANFTKTHLATDQLVAQGLSVTVPASTTASFSKSISPGTIPNSETLPRNMSDYIGLLINVSEPSSIQSITIKFDCGDGSFNTDYFYKVVSQGPLQSLLSSTTDPTTAAASAILGESIGVYGPGAGSVGELNTGLNAWTPFLFQLVDFTGAGNADYSDPTYNWSKVNGYQITIVTNDNSSVTVISSSLVLFGGAGPDVLGGVAYDYVVTFLNGDDGTESNPCMFMTNVNPPNDTNWVYPRRQPVKLTFTFQSPYDPQITYLRIYRRGGTLGDNFRRVDEVPFTGSGQTYLDTSADADIQNSDIVSLTNDVPVTSSLQTPVNTTLQNAITTTNQVVAVFPVSMANISVRQQVTLGKPTSQLNNSETVIVLSVSSTSFTAFVQNNHAAGEMVTATAQYGLPVTLMAQAYGKMWYAGDKNNPHYLYWSAGNNPQAVGSGNYVEVGTPDDPITAIVQFKGNLYVSTKKFWWAVAPGASLNQSAQVYPTAAKHGCVAPLGFVATEEAIYFQAADGIRAFAGGASVYLTQMQEFIFQGIGSSPIVEADQTKLSETRMQFWNNMIFVSYVGTDGARHRLIFHTEYKRWRNDDVDAQSLLLEAESNLLLYGDSNGLIHIDRQNFAYDESNNSGVLAESPIPITLQTPYSNENEPALLKNYIHCLVDADTGGNDIFVYLLTDDGESSTLLGTVNTAQRARVNIAIAQGIGISGYKASLKFTGNVKGFCRLYQGGLMWVPLAITRRDYDTYWLNLGTAESKICKQIYWDYNSTQPVTMTVYYDGSSTAGFTFTLPATANIRTTLRMRLPAVSFRTIRFVGYSTEDWQIWNESRMEHKTLPVGKGYMVENFLS